MAEESDVSKIVWTELDFEQMGWHDATVHGIGFEDDGQSARLLLDLDYIVRWINPTPPSEHFTFMVSPATLVFENVEALEGDLAPENAGERTALLIADVQRGDESRWVIAGHNFELAFRASGFHQHFRRRPLHVTTQRLDARARGGISFDEPSKLPS